MDITLSQIWAFNALNDSRLGEKPAGWFRASDKGHINGDMGGLVQSLAVHGYDMAQGTVLVLFELTKAQIKQAQHEIVERLDYLKAAEFLNKGTLVIQRPDVTDKAEAGASDKVEISSAAAVAAFKATYFDENGKPVAPKYGVNSGSRRAFALVYANAARVVMGITPITTVPSVVKHYRNDLERIKDNIRLNEDHKTGMRDLTDDDRINVALKLCERGARQADFTTVFGKRGRVQFLWEVATLNKLFPSLKIADRLRDSNDPLRLTMSHTSAMRDIRKEVEKDTGGDPVKVAERAKRPEMIEKVSEFLASPDQNKETVKIMARKELRDIASQLPEGNTVRELLLAVSDDKGSDVRALADVLIKPEAVVYHRDPETGELTTQAVTQEEFDAIVAEAAKRPSGRKKAAKA